MSRERTMMILVGALAVVLIGFWGSKQYRAAKLAIEKKYTAKQDELAKVGMQKQLAIKNADRWRDYGRRTLSTDPSQAQTRLRFDLTRLGDACGIQKTTVNVGNIPTPLGRGGRGQKEAVRLLTGSLHGEGRLDQVANFLFRVYSRPYMVRLKNLTLSRPARSSLGELAIEAQLEVPILPPTKLIPRVDPVNLPDLDKDAKYPGTQPAYADYRTITKRKIFQASQDVRLTAANPNPPNGQPLPIPEVATVDLRWSVEPAKDASYLVGYKVYSGESQDKLELLTELSKSQSTVRREGLKVGPRYYWRVDTTFENWDGDVQTTQGPVWSFTVAKKPDSQASVPQPPQPPQPPPRPADADFTLASILSSPAGQYAVLENRPGGQPAPGAQAKKVELGGEFFGGTLVYLHPRGAVSEKKTGDTYEWRFHPLGEPLEAGVKPLISDYKSPYYDVYLEVRQLRKKFEGITQAPGGSPNAGG